MKKLGLIIITSLLLLLALSAFQCSMKREAIGKTEKIVVVADSLLWEQVGPAFTNAVCKTVVTPQTEEIFNVLYRNPKMMNQLVRVPNIVILSTLEDTGYMKSIIDKVLNNDTRQRVMDNNAFLFAKEDVWAKQQMLAIVVSPDQETLMENLQVDGDKIFDLFDKLEQERAFKDFYRYENAAATKHLMQKYGWSVDVQDYFETVTDSAAANTVILHRPSPSRWFIVTWDNNKKASDLTDEWLLQKRQWLGETFLNGDYLQNDSLYTPTLTDVDFLNRPAIALRGLWANESTGGPVWGYAFYNDFDRRIYYIDMSLFAPGKKKYPFLRELDAMASTFKTTDEK